MRTGAEPVARGGLRRLSIALFPLVLACSHDWDSFRPAPAGSGGAVSTSSSSGAGSSGGSTSGPGAGGSGGEGVGAGGSVAVLEDCATPADEDGNGEVNDHCALWSKRFGDRFNQTGHAAAVDSFGNIFLTGELNGSTDFGGGDLTSNGGTDFYVAKFASNGAHLWSRAFGGALDEFAGAIAVDGSGNVAVTGTFNGQISFDATAMHVSAGGSDAFVLVLDPDGGYLWSRSFGGTLDDAGRGIAVDGAGNTVVAGNFAASIDLGSGDVASAGALDGFVVKLDTSGATLWAATVGDAADDSIEAVATLGGASVALTGYFAGAIDFGGGPLTAPPVSGTDAFVALLDEDGNEVSATAFGNDTSQLPQRGQYVRVDGDGNLVVAGTFVTTIDLGGGEIVGQGEDDIFVAKYSPAGAHLWSKGFGNAFVDGLGGIAVDGAGAVLLTGALRGGSVDFGDGPLIVTEPDDIFLLKLDAGGDHVWSRRFGITGDQDGGDVVTNAANEVVLTGFIEGTTDLGNGVLTSNGIDDILLAKLPP